MHIIKNATFLRLVQPAAGLINVFNFLKWKVEASVEALLIILKIMRTLCYEIRMIRQQTRSKPHHHLLVNKYSSAV